MNILKKLVISPHPDDETLGCGGTLLKFGKEGNALYWLIITTIAESLVREKEISVVSNKYNFKDVCNLYLTPTKLDSLPISDLIFKISKYISKIQPEIIFTCSNNDIHSDHHAVFNAVINATKPFKSDYVRKILMYETISETNVVPSLFENNFYPNYFVDISEHIEKKLNIMSIYKSEVMQYPLPRSLDSIKALARYRGSQCGLGYAEAFCIIREILK
jgi:LmbE family N-acetylglucosaminyl deacetylase